MASKALVRKLFKSLRVVEQSDEFLKNTCSVMANKYSLELEELGVTASEIDKIINKSTKGAQKGIIKLSEQIYTELFTDKQVEELISVYSSPTFQKLLKLMPEIQKRGITFLVERMDEIDTRIEQEIKSLLDKKGSKKLKRRPHLIN